MKKNNRQDIGRIWSKASPKTVWFANEKTPVDREWCTDGWPLWSHYIFFYSFCISWQRQRLLQSWFFPRLPRFIVTRYSLRMWLPISATNHRICGSLKGTINTVYCAVVGCLIFDLFFAVAQCYKVPHALPPQKNIHLKINRLPLWLCFLKINRL